MPRSAPDVVGVQVVKDVVADHVDVEPLTEHETESVEAVHPRVDPGVVEDRAGDAFLDDLDRLEP